MPAPIIVAGLVGGLIQASGTLVGRVLISLGIGYLAFTGMNTSLDWLRTQIAGSFSGFAAQSLAVLSALNAGAGISVLLSALAARMVLDGITNGTLKRLVFK